jgi:hypothetical protein
MKAPSPLLQTYVTHPAVHIECYIAMKETAYYHLEQDGQCL